MNTFTDNFSLGTGQTEFIPSSENFKKELGGFEVSKKVVFLEEMPKTCTGKIRKNILKEEHRDLYQQ